MEHAFGALGSGQPSLTIRGRTHTVREAMSRLGIAYEGCRAIDLLALGGGARFAVRYYDPDEQRIVVYEFDDQFRYLGETRVHVVEWVGEQALRSGEGWPAGQEEESTPWTWT
jgi:hypothetical protein